MMNQIDPTRWAWGTSPTDPREFAMLAHDIRGAMQGVIGGLQLIDSAALPPNARLQVERVAAAAATLAHLIATATGDSAGDSISEPDASRVDLGRFLAELGQRWSGEAHERGLSFEIHTGRDLPHWVMVEPVPLARILANLIGNAMKYTDAGAVRLSVTRTTEGGLAFRLLDDGPGLDPATLDHLFVFGHRPPGSGKPGLGLGLHIVKALCDQIGATVTLSNHTERGVEATMELPRRLVQVATEANMVGRPRADLSGQRILLAEDNPTNQMVAAQMLRALNATVTVASDGIEALERFEQEPFDLVVVDIEMPRKSGVDVIRAIRARADRRARVPIVALTAYAMPEHRTRIADAGADGLISKPILGIEALGNGLMQYLRPRPAGRVNGHDDDAADAAVDGPVVEMAVYNALCSAIGPDMMSELLEKVEADLVSGREALDRALAPLDIAAIRATSHILISVAGAIGAARLQLCARRLNNAAHAGVREGLEREVRTCLTEIAAAVDFARDRRSLG